MEGLISHKLVVIVLLCGAGFLYGASLFRRVSHAAEEQTMRDNPARDNPAQIVNKQREFFATRKTKDISFRLRMLKRLGSVIDDYEQRLIEALHNDLSKSPFESYMTEIGVTKEELHLHRKRLRSWAKPKRVRTPLAHFMAASFIYPEPYGVVLIIAPWNYPFQLLFTPLIGAISAGNCVVLKPSEYSPKSSAVMQEMIEKSFEPEYISLFQGGIEMAQALLQEKFDYIFYTGSSSVGRKVMEHASKHLTPVTLELGGKSPCIVDHEANIDLAARRIAWGKFLNAGQTCVAPDYLLVHREVKRELIRAIEKYIKEFFGKNPKESDDFARIINKKHFDRLCLLMEGTTILTGGSRERSSRYIAPTLIQDVLPESPIMQEEIFGPLLPVLGYETLDEAIGFVNSRPKPLALYFFSDNKKKQKKVLQQTSFGGGCMNDTVLHVASRLPFGGVGNSGMGSYHGRASFETFSHRKSVLKRSNLIDLRLRYAPFNGKLKKLKRFM